MNRKKVIPLIAALIFGLISARMVVQLLHSKNTVTVAKGPQLVSLVMAAKDLAAGEQLEDDDLRVGQMVADSAPEKTFSDSSELVGRVIQAPLVSGQPIVEALLAPKGSGAGLQAVIPPDMRAITIVVDDITGVAGNVTAGCHVDLLQTLHDDVSNQPIARAVLQNILVTAVGSRPQHGVDAQPGANVTLLVTPRQSELIELATSNGRVRLALRGSRDQKINNGSTVTLAELTGVVASHPVEAPLPQQPKIAAADPFAGPATRPSVIASDWRIRVITGGESSMVNVRLPDATNQTGLTGGENETQQLDGR